MKSFEINRSIRKGWGDVNPAERIHAPKNEKGNSRAAWRQELEDEIDGALNEIDMVGVPVRLQGGKKHTAMRHLKTEKGESVIPPGIYCYGKDGNCPYWDKIPGKGEQQDGWCWFLEQGDWQDEGTSLLWDQCKSCGVNEEIDIEDLK